MRMMVSRQPFIGRNLFVARTFHGLTQSELAERVGTATHAAIARYEKGIRQPTADIVHGLCDALQMEPEFFRTPLREEFTEETAHFRRRRTATLTARNRALSHGTLFASVVHFLENYLDFPEQNIPEIRVKTPDDIEKAANACRIRWGLGGDRPLEHVARVAENAGAIVARFDCVGDGEHKVDAFSNHSDRSIIVINSEQSASRCLFDVAHELGHLVMHGGMVTGSPETEDEADTFASAFLLPRTAMMREFPRGQRIQWDSLIEFKRRWRVSLSATIRRAFDLRLIDSAQYHGAYKYMASKGWHRCEPAEPEREAPEAIPLSFEVMAAEYGETPESIANRMGWLPPVLRSVTSVDIGQYTPPPKRGQLVLVDWSARRGANEVD